MVRQWQELFFDKRYSFTEMTNPDFGAIAQGNGIAYRCVEKRDELETAIHAMKEHPGAFLLEVRVEKGKKGREKEIIDNNKIEK